MQKENFIKDSNMDPSIAGFLSGRISSAIPDNRRTLDVYHGSQVILKVDGCDLNSSGSKCIWSVNWKGGTYRILSEGQNQLAFTPSYENEQSNRLMITCGIYEYRFNSSGFPSKWEWSLTDSCCWNIRIIHDTAPLWKGTCYLEDITDIHLMKDYTEITGSLRIGMNIGCLHGLEKITSISGDLLFLYNKCLKSYEGLDGLTYIGGSLDIWQNSGLTGLEGLSGIETAAGNLYISGNPSLRSLSGLSGLRTVGGDFNIYNNSSLEELGMPGLQRAGGNFWINLNCRLSTPLAEGLRDQVMAQKGIGADISIKNNKKTPPSEYWECWS